MKPRAKAERLKAGGPAEKLTLGDRKLDLVGGWERDGGFGFLTGWLEFPLPVPFGVGTEGGDE